jgi:hypothetical protein
MHRSFRVWLILGGLVVGCAGARLAADSRRADFGAFVQSLLDDRSEELFGIGRPLDHSAVGPFDGPSVDALELAPGLKATLVSSAVENAADQIALWPDDDHPTHLFVCDEETSSPAVQRVDLSQAAGSNATTIVTGLESCDPVRRTAWGTIIVGEEHGIDGGLYEILDPVHITTAIAVTNRATERFIAGSQQLGMPDNVAFQPHTGNLVVLEDGPTSIVRADGTTAAWERSVDLPARRPRRRRAVGWMRPLRVAARYLGGAERVHLPRVRRSGVRQPAASRRRRRPPPRLADDDLRIQGPGDRS